MPKIYSRALTKAEMDELVIKYPLDIMIEPDTEPWASQYDQRSASINYAIVRDFKPKVVVEFGARAGRCTRDITQALIDNGGDYIIKSYELVDGLRSSANYNLSTFFGDKAPVVGGDIMKATDVPDNIDYLFIDNDHDESTTEWVFDDLIPKKCADGCLVHFHDVYLRDDFAMDKAHGEGEVMLRLHKEHKFPFKKVYWTYEEGGGRTSNWFQLSLSRK